MAKITAEMVGPPARGGTLLSWCNCATIIAHRGTKRNAPQSRRSAVTSLAGGSRSDREGAPTARPRDPPAEEGPPPTHYRRQSSTDARGGTAARHGPGRGHLRRRRDKRRPGPGRKEGAGRPGRRERSKGPTPPAATQQADADRADHRRGAPQRAWLRGGRGAAAPGAARLAGRGQGQPPTTDPRPDTRIKGATSERERPPRIPLNAPPRHGVSRANGGGASGPTAGPRDGRRARVVRAAPARGRD